MTARPETRKSRVRARRPEAEALEGRVLLANSIGQWTYSSRITFSFMPDGTSLVGGGTSLMFATFNAVGSTASWEAAIEQAASSWQDAANVNLALVSDGGQAQGISGDQQDDSRFGDIRIGAAPLAQGVLAETYLPPPSNGGTLAGDIIFNSNVQWTMGGVGYDIQTVATHEFGHALGLPDISNDTGSVMYYSYDGVKDSLDSTDVTDIQAIYGAPQYDRFNTGVLHNSTPITATNITPYLSGSDQIALSGLDNTTPTDSEYYAITVPSGATSTMTVTLQSSNLSSLAPNLYILNSSLTFLASVTGPTNYGSTLTATVPVTVGQKYYIKVATTGVYGEVGGYGLEVNLGTQSMSPIAPPDTLVTDQPDQGGGSIDNAVTAPGGHAGNLGGIPGLIESTIGGQTAWAAVYSAYASGYTSPAVEPTPATGPTDPSPVFVGPVATPVAPSSTSPATATSTATFVAPLPAPATTPAPAGSSQKLVHQAVDSALPGWSGHRRRPRIGGKARSALHGHVVVA